MQTLHPAILSGTVPVQFPIIQSQARNQWIDINNESSVTLQASLGGRVYFVPPNATVRYAMDNTETFVSFTPQSAANGTTDTVSGTVYNEQDNTPIAIERGANAADILPVTSAMIADGAVIASKVATDAINTANIVNAAVATAKIANAAITNPLLGALAVATGNVQAGAITNPLLGASSVATGNVQAGAITNPLLGASSVATGNIQSGAVTNATLAALAVANANIQNAAVDTAQLANGSVTTTKIANLAVTNALIGNAAVGTAQIANAAITTALIQTAAITDALIANVSASKITAGTITATISINSPTINGGTVIGATIETATSGTRITLAGTVLTFYSGSANETAPSTFSIVGAGGASPGLLIQGPKITGRNQPTLQVLNIGPVDGTMLFGGIFEAQNAAMARWYISTAQSIPNATDTVVNWAGNGTVEFQRNVVCTVGAGGSRIFPQIAGYYRVSLNVRFATSVGGDRNIYIALNGATGGFGPTRKGQQSANTIAGQNQQLSCSGLMFCNGSTDYIEGWVYQASGGALNIDNIWGSTNIQVEFVST